MSDVWVDDTAGTELDEAGGRAGHGGLPGIAVKRFALEVLDGPAAGATWTSSSDKCAVGSHAGNDLVIPDRNVSRFHFEIRIEKLGPLVTDLESTNGTSVDGVPIVQAYLRDGSLIRVGQTTIGFRVGQDNNPVRLSSHDELAGLVGRSAAMRALFAILERAASGESTVVLEGETGTGKTEAAQAIHELSERRDGPFVCVDCGAIPNDLLETELFGHERGAFTGATEKRLGAFEVAHGGTIFLDEIGEMPPQLQPKLLRVLEQRTIKRVGSSQEIGVDVRIIAASNRDLRMAVNRGDFRADLYYRLAVIRAEIPPLRRRPEDIPVLVAHLARMLQAEPAAAMALLQPEYLAALQRGAWPGNVRQLRNHIERFLVLGPDAPDGGVQPMTASTPGVVSSNLPFAEARRVAIEQFEAAYLTSLLARHDGNVSQAARVAQVNRVYLHRLLRRHGLRG